MQRGGSDGAARGSEPVGIFHDALHFPEGLVLYHVIVGEELPLCLPFLGTVVEVGALGHLVKAGRAAMKW
jgi:hypothetical protein